MRKRASYLFLCGPRHALGWLRLFAIHRIIADADRRGASLFRRWSPPVFWLEDTVLGGEPASFASFCSTPPRPLAVGEVFSTLWDCMQQRFERTTHRLQIRTTWCIRLNHICGRIASLSEISTSKPDVTGHRSCRAVVHGRGGCIFDLAIPNFGLAGVQCARRRKPSYSPSLSLQRGFLLPVLAISRDRRRYR